MILVLVLTAIFGFAFAIWVGSILQREEYYTAAVTCYVIGVIFFSYMLQLT